MYAGIMLLTLSSILIGCMDDGWWMVDGGHWDNSFSVLSSLLVLVASMVDGGWKVVCRSPGALDSAPVIALQKRGIGAYHIIFRGVPSFHKCYALLMYHQFLAWSIDQGGIFTQS